MKHQKQKALLLFLAVCVSILSTGCFAVGNFLKEIYINQSDPTIYQPVVTTSVNQRENITPMGEQGTWSIFIYLCGTDLESIDAAATEDLVEMCDSVISDNINIIIQTGGTKKWWNDAINPKKIQRYIIKDNDLKLLEEEKLSSMGSWETLSSFLNWGVENYPAEKMGVIFWNHGGGSITGICFDELFNNDSLSLMEISNAFNSIYDKMTSPFEFIGFDACLMATLETASVLAPHAKYLIASEESEPGYGWNYTDIFNFINKNPESSGAELGVSICDSYYKTCRYYKEESTATLSVTDLSKIPALIEALDEASLEIYYGIDDTYFLSRVSRGIAAAENYGGNSKYEGYTNMVDLGDIFVKLSGFLKSGNSVLEALKEAVVYQVNGRDRSYANGLAIYYPLRVQGSSELSIFRQISPSRNYYDFVIKMIHGSQSGGFDDFLGDDSIINEYEPENDNIWDNQGSYFDDDSLIRLSEDPHFTDEGYYTFTFDTATLDYVQGVYCVLYYDNGSKYYYLGVDNNVWVDWDTGRVEDNFYGEWLSLPDGQPLNMNIIFEGDDYNLYSVPILLNGKETNMRIRWDYNLGEYQVLGAWSGLGENGFAARDLVDIVPGDIITPIYEVERYNNTIHTEYGYNYKVQTGFKVEDLPLRTGEYWYCFEVVNVFGNSSYTDFVIFEVDEYGDIYYSYPE